MEPIIGEAQAPPDTVKDSDIQHFQQDVLVASREVPVIVDFWAPWCGPCKTLGPILEKVVKQAGGKVKLVKIDIDQNPEIAQQMRIQSIPAVYAFHNGQPVDGFVGALPESQIKAFVQRLTGDSGPSQIEQAVEMAQQALEDGQVDQAADVFGQVLRAEPQNPQALAGLAHCHIRKGELQRAAQVLEQAGPEIVNQQDVASARAALELAEQADAAAKVDLGPLRARLEADPNDHEARLELANALVAAGQREAGVDELLEIVRRDRAWNEEAARKQLLKLFEAFGMTDPLTVSARRQLSSILFS